MKKHLLLFLLSSLFAQDQFTNIDSLYYSYDEIRDSLYAWQVEFGEKQHPFDYYQNSIVYQLDSIGYSNNENLPIYAVKLSVNANLEEDKPKILILGQCHAEEIYGIEMSMSLINWFLYPEQTDWYNNELPLFLHNLEIWIVPTHNPEGLNVVHGYNDENNNWVQDITYRKNKTDVNKNGKFDYVSFFPSQIAGNDSDGVDLNRNYGLNWMFGDDKYELNLQSCPSNQTYSSNYDYYKGELPFSEKETQAVKNFVLDKQFIFSVAYHSSRSGCVSERVIYPWAWEWNDLNFNDVVDLGEAKTSPDFNIISSLAKNIASLIQKEAGGFYNARPQKSRNGNAHDWMYSQTGTIQFLIEMGSSNIQPMTQNLIDHTIEQNRKGLFYLLQESIPSEALDTRHIQGIVVDSSNGLALENVEYRILGSDHNILVPRRTNEFGKFHRIAPKEQLILKFSAIGYYNKEVVVNNDELNVEMVPLESKQITFNINNYQNLTNLINIELYDVSGKKISFDTSNQFHSVQLYNEQYKLIAYGNEIKPYYDNIHIDADTIDIFLEIKDSAPIDLVDDSNWIYNDDWNSSNNILVSQSNNIYSNNLYSLAKLDNIISVDSDQLIAIELNLQYELEWDKDTAYFNIFSSDTIFNIVEWSSHNWEIHKEYFFVPIKSNKIYGIEFGIRSDNSLGYRGLKVHDIHIFNTSIPLSNKNIIIPQKFTLYQNYPNPFNPSTNIEFYLPSYQTVHLNIYDIRGRLISSPIDGIKYNPGYHQFTISQNDINLSSGIYLYSMETDDWKEFRKMLIIK